MDNETIMIVLYLMVYRLAIIASGIVCIVIGYRLFYKGAHDADSSVKASFSNMSFIFKNVTPGTLFAGFGMIIITSMILSGTPEYIYKDMKVRSLLNDDTSISTEESRTTTEIYRNIRDDSSTISYSCCYLDFLKKGNEFEKNGKKEEAINQYQKAINEGMKSFTGVDWLLFSNLEKQINSRLAKNIKKDYNLAVKGSARAINALAWMYTKDADNIEEGLILARIAVKNDPDEPKYLDTLAELLFQNEEYDEALNTKKIAIIKSKPEYKSIYSEGLDRFENAIKNKN